MNWLPIETAPHKTEVLLLTRWGVVTAEYRPPYTGKRVDGSTYEMPGEWQQAVVSYESYSPGDTVIPGPYLGWLSVDALPPAPQA